jgi:hypothetical protein
MKRAVEKLDTDERNAVTGAVLGWYIDASPLITAEMLALEVEDYFAIGDGLSWGWSEKKIKTLLEKLQEFAPSEAMGLILWCKDGK